MEEQLMESKKYISFLLALALIFNILAFTKIQINAHDTSLNVTYDQCTADISSDGVDEIWYSLINDELRSRHIGQDEVNIKYYFYDRRPLGTYTWTPNVLGTEDNAIKSAIANSMEKWNNVWFYDYSNNGKIIKRKIITVVEGTETDHNLSIYPASGNDEYASTGIASGQTIVENGTVFHEHYLNWEMTVYVESFKLDQNDTEEDLLNAFDRVGAHEIGHVLGLWDVDKLCDKRNTIGYHHHELLMGYGYPISKRSSDITYKDIAGVAITRGFHTDDDHKWLNAGIQEDGTYKLICSICNGVKYVESLSGISYSTYGYCNSNHDLSDGNMMAVASYGNCDYYKCKYCRYVAPFSDIVPQDYEITYISETYHQYQNMVDGLEYTILEPHIINENYCSICQSNIHFYTHQYVSYSDYAHKAFCECGEYILEDHRHLAPSYDCVFCGAEHKHTYATSYEWVSDKIHTATCVCGESKSEGHVVSATAFPINGRKICLLCGGLASEGFSQMAVGSLPHTENGSYITPDGITVLADEDIKAFLNGTLEFIYPSDSEAS